MAKLLLICILVGLVLHPKAQLQSDKTPEDLIAELHKNNPDSTRLQLLLQLARKHYFERVDKKNNPDSLLILLQQAQALSVKMNSLKWQPEICCYLAKYYYRIGNIKTAIEYNNKAIAFINNLAPVEEQIARWKKLGWNIPVLDSVGITRIICFEKMQLLYRQMKNIEKDVETQREIADTYMKQGKLDLAEKELLDALQQYKAIGYPHFHYCYNLLAITNRLKGNYDKALRYALLTIESMQKTGDTISIRTFYAHLAYLYHEMGQTEKSIQYHKIWFQVDHQNNFGFYYVREVGFFVADLIKAGQQEEAGKFLLRFSKEHPAKDLYSKAIMAKMYAEYYRSNGDETKADHYIQDMIRIEPLLGRNNEIKRDIAYDIGQYYFRRKQFEKAENYFEKALDEAMLNNSVITIKDIHLMLFKTDSSLGNYVAAIRHLNDFRQLNDSIFTQAKIKEAEEVQVRYETEKKEQSIKLLEQESKLQQVKLSEASVTRNRILAGGVLLLVIIGLLTYNSRLKQRTNKKLALQQTKIEKQNISLRHLVTEKEWLLKEIHHRVKNNLQIVMSLLNSQSAFIDNKPALTAIQDSQHRVQAMSLIHQKLYNSESFSSIDMSFYIRELTSYLRDSFNTGQRIHFEFQVESLEMNVSQAIPLGLILNEAITNSIKYAFPDGRNGVISISLSTSDSRRFILCIADNGIGVPPGFDISIRRQGSLGMSLIEGLSADLEGDFSIENDNGTVIKVSFVPAVIPEQHDPTATTFVLNS